MSRGRLVAWSRLGFRWGLVLLLLLGTGLPAWGEADKTNRAKIKISGFGFLGNLELKKQLRLMQKDRKPPVLYRASQIEDAVLILLSKLKGEGYLAPTIAAELTLTNDLVQSYSWTKDFDTFLPPELLAKKVVLRAHHGVRYYYEQLDINGLHALPVSAAKEFFVASDALLRLKSMRVFTPDLREASLNRLRAALNRRGYINATVTAQSRLNPTNGAVRVTVDVTENKPTLVHTVAVAVVSPSNAIPQWRTNRFTETPLSGWWREDFAQSLLTNQYDRGFPDANVELTVLRRETNAATIQADLSARVNTGTNITLGGVHFEGQKRTHMSVLRRFTRLTPGEPLNRIEIERGRERLARLGIFESVRLKYNVVDPHTRNAVYELKEGKFFDSRLLLSYGSYDTLGGGIELTYRNVFGLAHQASLRARQTFKSTLADFRYTLPEVLRQKADVFFSGTLLLRQEITFDRKEYGGGVGVHRYWPRARTDTSVRYDYQFLNAQSGGLAVGQVTRYEATQAAAIVFEFKHDRRNSPLRPERGYMVFGNLEFASDKLGGQVSYQRFLLGGSTHWDLGGGRIIHLGAVHGLTYTWDGSPDELPFNKRFFPGGDNSVRGYQHGAAAPRNANGEIIGAETFLQGNAEFEQFLTQTISVVAFMDAVGFAQSRDHYPCDTALYSAGGGLRWHTVIGPVRLEYGYNLNPRPQDPSGTLHFSFGFPF